ncbi:hypothetical protein F3Y22_tig00111754pilonHSYRG00014 [Hibiscus syriacus]|uniref:Terpene synthase metal-binding domain-containing protein n=1 Tax=Hibiscus syriacus TaxID=106335 RepID=A0A6A2XWM7_HIBSY|nr:hypothetical protein F3Y22_tig00111754pilonHSYRG00014 [Hibiscus syriacus]
MNFKHWGGANGSAPILVYLGAEVPLDSDLTVIGFLNDNAIRFNALLDYIEHRYYGKSIPFGSREEAFKNASTLGYFNSVQAIADYVEIIVHIKKKLNAFYSPVIVIGGSFGGRLDPTTTRLRDCALSTELDRQLKIAIWPIIVPTFGGNFSSLPSEMDMDARTQQEYQELKQQVRRMLVKHMDKPSQKVHIVDAVQRLGPKLNEIRKVGFQYGTTFAQARVNGETDETSVSSHYTEAKWLHEIHANMVEYLSVAYVSCCYPMLTLVSFVGMEDSITKETFIWAFNDP